MTKKVELFYVAFKKGNFYMISFEVKLKLLFENLQKYLPKIENLIGPEVSNKKTSLLYVIEFSKSKVFLKAYVV